MWRSNRAGSSPYSASAGVGWPVARRRADTSPRRYSLSISCARSRSSQPTACDQASPMFGTAQPASPRPWWN